MMRFAKTKTILLALAVLPTALILACGGDTPPTTVPVNDPAPMPMPGTLPPWAFDVDINTYPPPRVTPDVGEYLCLGGALVCGYVDDQGFLGYSLLTDRATTEYCEQLALIPNAAVTCIEVADDDFRVVGKESEWVNEFPRYPN